MALSQVRPAPGGSFRRPLKCADFILQHLRRVGEDNISSIHRAYREALRDAALQTGRLHETDSGALAGRPYQTPTYSSFVRTIWVLAKPATDGSRGAQIEPSSQSFVGAGVTVTAGSYGGILTNKAGETKNIPPDSVVVLTDGDVFVAVRTEPSSIAYLRDKRYYRLATGAKVPESTPAKPIRVKPKHEVEIEPPTVIQEEQPIRITVEGELPLDSGRRKKKKKGGAPIE